MPEIGYSGRGVRGISSQRGFTLLEILVVMLVIGVLAAIALPAYLGQRSKAQDADAKSNAGNIRVDVEACATWSDHTYADCATASQIEAGGLPVGFLLPPLNQFAAAGGNDNDNNGVKNGAQCIVQSNGTRACEQTSSGGDTTGTNTGTNTTTTPTTTTTTSTTTTTPGDVQTGGSAPDVGDCVEGGTVEQGCVGIVASSGSYTITAVSKSTHVFKIVSSSGHVTRPCDPAGSGGCPSSGSW